MAFPTFNFGQVRVGASIHNDFIQNLVDVPSAWILVACPNDLTMQPHPERDMNSLLAKEVALVQSKTVLLTTMDGGILVAVNFMLCFGITDTISAEH